MFGSAADSTTSFGVFSGGNLGASGTKSFVIDHPLDPANKMLKHYSTEAPKPLNSYRGTVTNDGNGYATVQMPDYYEEINIDPTYQLTIIGGEGFALAKIERKLVGNTFVIRTSEPNIEVCWRVEARRNDRFVRAYGAPIEVEKPRELRGRYLGPELYGLGQEYNMRPTRRSLSKPLAKPDQTTPKLAAPRPRNKSNQQARSRASSVFRAGA